MDINHNIKKRNILLLFVLMPFLLISQICDIDGGGILELQMTTSINGIIRGNGFCLKPTTILSPLTLQDSVLKIIPGTVTGQVLYWSGTAWIAAILQRDTSYNGLTDLGIAHVLGGPLVQNTSVQGQNVYTITFDDLQTFFVESQRISGTVQSTMRIGSTPIDAFTVTNSSTANAALSALLSVNYTNGNLLQHSNSGKTAVLQQLLQGDDEVIELTTINGGGAYDAITLRLDRDLSISRIQRGSVSGSPGLMTWDTITDAVRYVTPYTAGSNITISANNVVAATADGDGSSTNEGSLLVLAGTATTSVVTSNTLGSTGVTFTAGSGLSITESGNVITLANTGDTDAQNDLTTFTSFSGDVTGTFNTLQIVTGAVINADIANATITGAKMVTGTVGSTQITDLGVTNADIADTTITGGKIVKSTINPDRLGGFGAVNGDFMLYNSATTGGAWAAPATFLPLANYWTRTGVNLSYTAGNVRISGAAPTDANTKLTLGGPMEFTSGQPRIYYPPALGLNAYFGFNQSSGGPGFFVNLAADGNGVIRRTAAGSAYGIEFGRGGAAISFFSLASGQLGVGDAINFNNASSSMGERGWLRNDGTWVFGGDVYNVGFLSNPQEVFTVGGGAVFQQRTQFRNDIRDINNFAGNVNDVFISNGANGPVTWASRASIVTGGGGLTTSTSFSGDVSGTFNNLQIVPSTIINADIADATITGAKMVTGTVNSTQITDLGVNNADIAAFAISADKIGPGAVTTAKIDDGAVTTAKLDETFVTAGTYGSPVKPVSFTVGVDGRLTSASETAYVATTYSGGGTFDLGENEQVVYVDPTTANTTIRIFNTILEGVKYNIFVCCNLTNFVRIEPSSGTFKVSGAFGTQSTFYQATAGQHLELIRHGTVTYISKK